ncbi:GGDEF domain-containing protein [Sinimarinibacterium thermocellulolyticum]|uniref:diguanylate cyclase n=1 Tax=Sinimarinibacterium thermocellulolyticum TaxID=3170016 RepID=A0ABV2A6V1_9GAMM
MSHWRERLRRNRHRADADAAELLPVRAATEHRLLLSRVSRGESRLLRFPVDLEAAFKAYSREQAAPARITTTLITALLFLGAPLWSASMLGVPESTRTLTLWISVLALAPAFAIVTALIYLWPRNVMVENVFIAAFLLEAVAIEVLRHDAVLAGYRVTPVISVAVPVAALALARLSLLRSLVFVALYVVILVAGDRLATAAPWARTPTETLTIAILLSVALVSSAFAQHTRRQNWALLQLMRAGALVDFLTGLANRSAYEAHVERWTRLGRREGKPYTMAVVDLDYFKRINDRYGHQHGDGVLREVALTLEQFARRPGDLAARVGGEEFVLFLYGCDRDAAARRLERLRATIEALGLENVDSPHAVVTASIGAVTITRPEPVSASYEKADQALYQAKRAGRNRVVIHDPAQTPPN